MERPSGKKHISRWRQISVVDIGRDPVIFDLDEHGKLTKKIRRQSPRDLSEELKKIPMKDVPNSQFLTNSIPRTPNPQPSNIFSQNSNMFDQSTFLVNQSMPITVSSPDPPIFQDDSSQFDLPFFSDIFSSDYGGIECTDERFYMDDSNLLADPLGLQF